MQINQITSIIIEECIYIHKKLGPGLFESIYEEILYKKLVERGLHVERQKTINLEFEGEYYPLAFRVDLVVNNCVLIELKSVETLPKVAEKQVLSYLRIINLPIGLLINFNVRFLVEGIIRIANKYEEAE